MPAFAEHLAAGYYRKPIGLNHLAFRGKCRAQVDQIAKWVKDSGRTLPYEDRHPFAGGPNYYAVFLEDPDRFKLQPGVQQYSHPGLISFWPDFRPLTHAG